MKRTNGAKKRCRKMQAGTLSNFVKRVVDYEAMRSPLLRTVERNDESKAGQDERLQAPR